VSRGAYACYLLSRLGEALLVALAAGLFACALQRGGFLTPLGLAAAWPPPSRIPGLREALERAAWWFWPASSALVAHLLLGPKQERPVYRRFPGAMYAYAGVRVDRSGGCRGGCVTGSTGSGKTLACILPRLHSLCIHECGVERPDWRASPAQRDFARRLREHRTLGLAIERRLASLAAEQRRACLDPKSFSFNGMQDKTEPGDGPDLLEAERARLRSDREALDQDLSAAADRVRTRRYRVPPWGGLVCGEKGNEGQSIDALLRRHGRIGDLCLLRTRPAPSPSAWTPPVRLNLLSMDTVPADTYAKAIVDTGLCVEESETRDEFFVPQARDKIAWGLRLLRAAGVTPSLLTLFDILTVEESYRRYVVRLGGERPQLAASAAFGEARFQLENNYWSQPPEQLGGVRSTLYNFLVPFSEPEIAAVFCADSTFDLRDIERGKVVCLAIPQKFALQRRYVATLLKALVYQVILERFDRPSDPAVPADRNVILVEQDEWQRHAVRADCDSDVVREAQGAVYAAAQSQNSVWLKLGGRDKAVPLLANLRNRWICQAATEECAEESSNLASGRHCRDATYSYGPGGRTTNVSFPDRPFLPKRELRSLPPFHVVFVPAEGEWLYRRCIAMPATADGRIPPWWFGDWNPLDWAARWLGLPHAVAGVTLRPARERVPPWRASAPLRAQLRWLLGLDGTFIILGGLRSRAARRAAHRRAGA
jgi:hypothetical protein